MGAAWKNETTGWTAKESWFAETKLDYIIPFCLLIISNLINTNTTPIRYNVWVLCLCGLDC